MRNAFDATIDVVIAQLTASTRVAQESTGQEVAAYAQVVYDKFKELEKDYVKTRHAL